MGGIYNLDLANEESSYSNIKGYFFLITKTIHSRIEAYLLGDLVKEYECLHALRWLLIGYFKEEELAKIDEDFTLILQLIKDYQNAKKQNLARLSDNKYLLARDKINKVADTLSLKMHKSGLYTYIKEKGNPIYN